eukprot:TRINITY_DN1374_c0_g1_i1.p1 TRINITY_DN1374_c0_g1~~TRINITY_DN1374_c0_g1_i1.p1  ORF type:complete len:113 (-),score=21.31 TRINITY_DN1374_c0_g1_i1:47-385(-)
MKKMDKNKDRKGSRPRLSKPMAFSKILQSQANRPKFEGSHLTEADLVDSFRVFDVRPEKGYLTSEEVTQALKKYGNPIDDGDLDDILALGDPRGEGKFDYRAFCSFLKQHSS